jgi:ABC-2 type transport system permease protein
MIAIAFTSFKEAIRKKIILLIGLMTLVYIIILTLLTCFAFESLRKANINQDAVFSNAAFLVSLLGFYFSSMIVALLTIMASIGTISSELENGSIHAIITKPVRRIEYILGKYLGLAVLVTLYSAFLYASIIVINYTVGVPPLDKPDIILLLKGLLLFILEPLTILALCIFGSVIFKTLSNGIVVIAIYILGAIGAVMEQIGSVASINSLEKWGIIMSLISPFDVIYRKMTAVIYSSSTLTLSLSNPLFLSNKMPSNWMMVYVCLFLAVMLFMAVRIFNRKDI